MLQDNDDQSVEKHDMRKSPISFLSKLFKWRRPGVKNNIRNSDIIFDRKLETSSKKCISCSVTCIPSVMSVKDVYIVPYPPSPALSIPSRNKNIDHDMRALRLSRQDDPFLKVLASRESLADSCVGEVEADSTNNTSQVVLPDIDPLTIPEFHKHMVRSPPPVNWPRSPVFRFDDSSQESLRKTPQNRSHHHSRESITETGLSGFVSPNLNIPKRFYRSSSAEAKERRCNSTFSLIPPSSFRSLSEVRRFHIKSTEENQYLVSSS